MGRKRGYHGVWGLGDSLAGWGLGVVFAVHHCAWGLSVSVCLSSVPPAIWESNGKILKMRKMRDIPRIAAVSTIVFFWIMGLEF